MELRIQVFSLFTISTLEVEASSVRLGGQVLPANVRASVNGSRVCAASVCGETLRTHGGTVRLAIPGKIERRFSGDAELTARNGELTAVVLIDIESAVAAVVAAEMPHAPKEAQRAQAVTARSYYAAHRHRHRNADFCDSTHCQFLTTATQASRDAASSTRGQVIRYRGQPVAAMYFRSCGGRTLRAEDVKLPGGGYPFASVPCLTCRRDPVRWSLELSATDAGPLLHAGPSEALRLELAKRIGWNRFPSNDYTILRRPESVILRGAGHGHGVGLCLRGAAGMAASGEGFAAILRHYFPAANLRE